MHVRPARPVKAKQHNTVPCIHPTKINADPCIAIVVYAREINYNLILHQIPTTILSKSKHTAIQTRTCCSFRPRANTTPFHTINADRVAIVIVVYFWTAAHDVRLRTHTASNANIIFTFKHTAIQTYVVLIMQSQHITVL